MRDVLLGLLSYMLSIGAFIVVMLICLHYFAPPSADRVRSFAFMGGGGGAFLLLMIAGVAIATIYSSVTGGLVR